MNLLKCGNGHYYDGDKFDACPHCSSHSSINLIKDENETLALDSAAMIDDIDNAETVCIDPITEPLQGLDITPRAETVCIEFAEDRKIEDELINSEIEPVVGWLVCIEGDCCGRSFDLKAGENYVGRIHGANDIVLQNDRFISREKHAVVVFDVNSCRFFAKPGTSSELYYINDEVVLQSVEIKQRDVIAIGNTKLMFVPFCGPDFIWNDCK